MAVSPLMDGSKQKAERRRTTYKLIRRRKPTNILATNFPEPQGRKFVHKLVNLRVPITLVEKDSFSKAAKEDLKDIVTLVAHSNIFYQMLSNTYDFLDLDLCGALTSDGLKSIESCFSWKTILLTITDKFRSRWGTKPAAPKGVHIQQFIFDLCERKGWGCQLCFAPKPYKRMNKNELKGLTDGRGPWYYTFIITR